MSLLIRFVFRSSSSVILRVFLEHRWRQLALFTAVSSCYQACWFHCSLCISYYHLWLDITQDSVDNNHLLKSCQWLHTQRLPQLFLYFFKLCLWRQELLHRSINFNVLAQVSINVRKQITFSGTSAVLPRTLVDMPRTIKAVTSYQYILDHVLMQHLSNLPKS